MSEPSPTTPTATAAPPGPLAFLARGLAFAALVALLAFALSPLLRASPALAELSLGPAAEHELETLDDAGGLVLYQGDSVVGWGMAEPETSLPYVLADEAELPIINASHSAYGPRLFLAQLRHLERERIIPRGTLVGLSLASLGPFRERSPGWRFGARERALATGWLLPVRGASVFKHRFGALDDDAFRRTAIRSGGEVVGTLGQLAPRDGEPRLERDDPVRLRLACLAAYGAPLAASEQLAELRELFATLARGGRPHLVYLTPIDQALVARHLGADERATLQENRVALARLAAEAGARFVDLSAALDGAAFEPEPPTEHLNARGRRQLAAILGRELRPLRW